MHRLAGVLLLGGLWGCTYSTQAVIDIGLAAGADPPTFIEVYVYDALGTRANKTFAGAGLPGRVVLQLADGGEALRIAVAGASPSLLLGGTTVDTLAGQEVRASVILAVGTADRDGDRVPDSIDNCPDVANRRQENDDRLGGGNACGSGDGGAPPDLLGVDGGALLLAVHPEIANTGDTVFIEGKFDTVQTVNFPGGATASPLQVTAARVSVKVPAGASGGGLTVTGAGLTSNALSFRRASFPLAVQPFRADDEQTQVARAEPKLTLSSGERAVVAAGHVYAMGALISNPVESALIHADGTLGPFVEAARLTHNRWLPSPIVIGDILYVSGGYRNGTSMVVASVESATIHPDGTLDPFVLTGVSMLQARRAHVSLVIGGYLYVIGGSKVMGEVSLDSIERSPIAADGSLGAFEPGGTLLYKRTGPIAAVMGRYLYVMGGYDGVSDYPEAVERALIGDDGSLGPFMETATPWTQVRANCSSLVLGNSLYVAGGYLAGVPRSEVFRATLDAQGNLGPLGQIANGMVQTRYDFALALVENRVYAIGNSGSDDVLEHASIIGPSNLMPFQTVTAAQIPSTSPDASSVVLGRWLYLIGGASHPKQILRSPIAADGTPGAWVDTGLVLQRDRYGAALAVLEDKLYIIGGANPGTSVEVSPIGSDGTLGAFSIVPLVNTTKPRFEPAAIVKGGYLYLVAGDTTGPPPLDIERAQITNGNTIGTFASLAMPLLPAPGRSGTTAALFADSLYIQGGFESGGFTNTTFLLSLPPAGPMGVFTADQTMFDQRTRHTAIMIGSKLFLMGGQYNDSVEFATVAANGTVGPFAAPATSRILTSERWHHETTLLGNHVYVFGGVPDTVISSNKVDRAEIVP